ncbi:MAG: hypothetical protein ACK4MF_08495 [Hyphomicrobiaceae bacterium]
MRPHPIPLVAAALLSAVAMLPDEAAGDARETAVGGRLPIWKPQADSARPPFPAPGGKIGWPENPRPGLGIGSRPPAARPEMPSVCVGGRIVGNVCLCAGGSAVPALGQRVVRCSTPPRQR